MIAAGAAAIRPAHAEDFKLKWSLLGRYSQGTILYRGTEQDSGFHTSAGSIVDWLGLEARFGEKLFWGSSRHWKFSGSLQLDMLRQEVFGVPHVQPRMSARFSYGRYTRWFGKYGLAPMLEFHGGQYSIFRVTGAGQATQDTVMRGGFGLGLTASYRYRDVYHMRAEKEFLEFSVFGLARWDSGNHSPILPSEIQSSMSWEVGGSATVHFWRKWFIELRCRGMQETFQWRPAKGGTGPNSELTNGFSLFDFGLGLKY